MWNYGNDDLYYIDSYVKVFLNEDLNKYALLYLDARSSVHFSLGSEAVSSIYGFMKDPVAFVNRLGTRKRKLFIDRIYKDGLEGFKHYLGFKWKGEVITLLDRAVNAYGLLYSAANRKKNWDLVDLIESLDVSDSDLYSLHLYREFDRRFDLLIDFVHGN